jgi:hypothetical protein
VRIDAVEVELAGNQEEHGSHGGKAGVAAGFAFGGLEEAIEGLDEAIGLTGLGPGDNTVEVPADYGRPPSSARPWSAGHWCTTA